MKGFFFIFYSNVEIEESKFPPKVPAIIGRFEMIPKQTYYLYLYTLIYNLVNVVRPISLSAGNS